MRSTRLRCSVVCCALLALGCAARSPKLDANLAAVWKEYRALPESRALALAGNPRADRFVTGASGGHASSEAAAESALRECRARRHRLLMVQACKLYALGDEIVWPGP